MNLPHGHLLQKGKYRLTNVVGQGGFGITYKGVWHTEVKGSLGTIMTDVPISIKEYFFKDYCYRDEHFAVKVHSETGNALFDKFKEKLLKEARILSDVHHPYIVNVLEVFEENNTAYIAMEYISGLSLKQMMERTGTLPEKKMLKYVRQIAEALSFVHEKNILHLDIKPSNILIDKDDNARLIDFGVSKRYDIEEQETSTTMLTLSKGFASIEQYDNEGTQNFSPRPDIYSLGATMYNLLTGVIPIESILRATKPLQKPSEINPAVTPETEEIIMKAMQVIPEERFQTIEEILKLLPVVEASDSSDQKNYSGGDTTIIFPSAPTSQGEQKILAEKTVTPPKKRKRVLLPLLLSLFVIIASAVALIQYTNKPTGIVENKTPSGTTVTQPKDDESKTSTEFPTEKTPTEELPAPDDNTKNTGSTETTTIVTEPTHNTTAENQPQPVETPAGENTAVQLSDTELNAQYELLVESGKAKIDREDYEGAKKDLEEAKNLHMTEEVIRLIVNVDLKADEKRIKDRLAQYEQKMPLGNFLIVRKVSTGKYGAIDLEGYERIPCKYAYVDIAENGRIFVREDNLYDIYNENGDMVSEGLTYY